MIDDLDRTIRNLLAKELPEVQRGDVEISFNQPDSEWSARLGNKPTLNIFLYDVRENAPLRQHHWQQVDSGVNGGEHKMLFKRTPLRMDCFYLVSAWSPADAHTRPFEEHRLLTQSMLALARYPVLNGGLDQWEGRRPAPSSKPGSANGAGQSNGHAANGHNNGNGTGFLVGQLATLEYEVRTRLAFHDVMTNPAELWSALENRIRAAYSYVVTLALEPWANQLQEAGAVGTVTINTGQTPPPPVPSIADGDLPPTPAESTRKDAPDESAGASLVNIGGMVRDQTQQMQPVATMKVTIMEPDLFNKAKNIGLYKEAFTDDNGRFRFRRLPPGEFVLVVGPDIDHPLVTKQITVAAGAGSQSNLGDGYADLVIGEAPARGKATKTRRK